MSVLVVAVSSRSIMFGADQLYADLSEIPPRVRVDERKVFRGPQLLTGMVGTVDTPAGSLAAAVAACAGEPTVRQALARLRDVTAPWLPTAYAQWRERVGLELPPEAFGTVICGGIGAGGIPGAIELSVTETAFGAVGWTKPLPMTATSGESYVDAYGAVDANLLAATSRYPAAWASGDVAGPPPRPRPGADERAAGLFTHVRGLVDGAVAREAALPRPGWWPAGVPVLGGPALLAAL